jgi:hypothetical protein
MQVIVVPHVPSVEMAWEAVEVEDVFEEVVVVELEVTFVEVVDFTDVVLDDVQFPEAGWQPVPQYAEVEPHHPALEQQFPNVEP